MTETDNTAAGKIIALLEALSASDSDTRDGQTIVEISRVLGREKSVVSRQLKPLVELGIVERGNDGRHRLGWRLFAIAARAGDQRLLLLAPPVMRKLTQQVRERVHLSILRGPNAFTILSESPNRAIEAAGWVGRAASMTSTSAARALLFDHSDEEIHQLLKGRFEKGTGPQAPRSAKELIERLAAARRQGFAITVDEFDDDLSAVAAPVRDAHGRIVAALNISAPSHRMDKRLMTIGRQVSHAAQHLGRALSTAPDEMPPPPPDH